VLLAVVTNFANRSRIGKVIAMFRVAPFLIHGLEYCIKDVDFYWL